MNSKLICVVLLCLSSFSKKSFVYGDDNEVLLVDKKSHPNSWVIGLISLVNVHPDYVHNCREYISPEKRICELHINIDYNLPVNCFWNLDAGVGERVFINSLYYYFTPNEGFSPGSNYPYDDALNLGIYDGNQVNESKLLFKLGGDKKFENITSTGRNLTIGVDFKKSNIYRNQHIVMRMSYIP